MIKLIATDIDGTLVKDGSLLIDPEYMSVIDRLIDKGIIFVVCSGRQFSSEFKLFAPIKHKLLYITDGGTVVRTPKEILKTYPMDEDIWKGMCRMVRDELPACDYFAATPDFCFAEDGGSPICCFGDNLNDIEMLQNAGISYAVSNARQEVIAAAKHTCAPYWENGVLSVLKSFL